MNITSSTKTQYLYTLDLASNRAYFLGMSRDDFNMSSFLDQRITCTDHKLTVQNINQLLSSTSSHGKRVPNFIFHTAFCCSTLLARSLDIPGKTMVFREPMPLLQIADIKRRQDPNPYPVQALLKSTVNHLLDMPFAEDKIIIKPTNLSNNLITDLMRIYPLSRAILLHDSLESFIISVIKRPKESEQGIQHFLNRFIRDNNLKTTYLASDMTGKLHYKAALAWALQRNALQPHVKNNTNAITLVTTDSLMKTPMQTLKTISSWLRLDISDGELQNMLLSNTWNYNSKKPSEKMNPEKRLRERRILESRFSAMVTDARRWLHNTIGTIADLKS